MLDKSLYVLEGSESFIPRDSKWNFLPARDAKILIYIDFPGISFRLLKMDSLWAIFEASTALMIVRGMDSQAHAIEKCKTLLDIQGVKKVQKVIADQLIRTHNKDVGVTA